MLYFLAAASLLLIAFCSYLFVAVRRVASGCEQVTDLMAKKLVVQNGLCALCGRRLPEKGFILDCLDGSENYTAENTQLIHTECPPRAEQQ
jgi:hypothetical protein